MIAAFARRDTRLGAHLAQARESWRTRSIMAAASSPAYGVGAERRPWSSATGDAVPHVLRTAAVVPARIRNCRWRHECSIAARERK
jgi:hypothetical protein